VPEKRAVLQRPPDDLMTSPAKLSLSDLDRFDLDQKPAWRYERVLASIGPVRPPRHLTHGDRYVRRMREWLLRLRGAGDAAARERLAVDFAGPAGAMKIHNEADAILRLRVEAGILARESDAAIAEKEVITPESVDWYEKVYFNVRDRIDASDWIVRQVLERQPGGAYPTDEHALKAFAYFCGRAAFEYLLSGFHSKSHPADPAELGSTLDEAISNRTMINAAMAVSRFDLRPPDHLRVLRNSLRALKDARKREKNETDGTEGQPDLLRNLYDTLQGIPGIQELNWPPEGPEGGAAGCAGSDPTIGPWPGPVA